jgi:heme-degrading monooxygenase HmoA
MIEIVWEFIVREDSRGQFELAFGPGGAWGKLFARSPGFRGTTLLRDMKNPRRYLVIDLWDSEAQREQVLAEGKAEYADLNETFGGWIESKTELGVFRMMAEATVRPHGSARRSRAGGARRKSPRTNR